MDTREIVMPTGGSSDGLLGGGGIGALLIGALLFGGGLGGFGMGNRGYGQQGGWSDAAKTDLVINPAFQSLQNQIDNVNASVLHGASDRSFDQTQSLIAASSAATQSAIANLSTAQATGNFTTLNSINGLGRDLVTNLHQTDLTQLNSFNQLTTAMLQGFNGSAMQLQNSTNQIIAQGTANAAAVAAGFCELSREMATCCCEIKQKITDDGQLTRSLINDLNVQNLRDQLSAANGKISNNEQNQYLLQTILSHLTPREEGHRVA